MTRIIFMGTPEYATSILKSLINVEDIEVVAVYTQPDKPVGRKALLTPPSVKVLAQQYDIPIFQPNRLRDEDVVSEVLNIPCDLIIANVELRYSKRECTIVFRSWIIRIGFNAIKIVWNPIARCIRRA